MHANSPKRSQTSPPGTHHNTRPINIQSQSIRTPNQHTWRHLTAQISIQTGLASLDRASSCIGIGRANRCQRRTTPFRRGTSLIQGPTTGLDGGRFRPSHRWDGIPDAINFTPPPILNKYANHRPICQFNTNPSQIGKSICIYKIGNKNFVISTFKQWSAWRLTLSGVQAITQWRSTLNGVQQRVHTAT